MINAEKKTNAPKVPNARNRTFRLAQLADDVIELVRIERTDNFVGSLLDEAILCHFEKYIPADRLDDDHKKIIARGKAMRKGTKP